MVETISVLRLTVPKIDDDAEALSLTADRIREWLESLPLAAVDEAATKVRDAVQKMNRGRLPTEQRYEIMELIRTKAVAIDLAMKKQREKSAFQPTARNRALAALHQSLLEEIAHGYKRILADLLQSGEPGRVPKAMIVAAHRTIDALTHVLLEAYVSYSLEPENTWGEIHRIYRFASQARIHDKPVPGGHRDDSIDRAYRLLILLYLANPYHLMQGEVYSLYDQLGLWVDGCNLTAVQSGSELAGQLYIDPEQDRPPLYAPSSMPAKPLAALMIDVTEASRSVAVPIEALELKRREKNGLPLIDRMKRDTLIRLRHAWEARRERSFQREPQNVEIEVIVGLSACHYYVSGEKNFAPEGQELQMSGEENKRAGAANLSLMSDHQEEWSTSSGMQMSLRSSRFEATDVGGTDAWESIFETKSQTIEKTLDYEDQFRQKFSITTWKQHDISDGGISISLGDVEPSLAIRVGEVVGYRSGGTDDAWSIGSVCWMQFLPGRGLSLGVRKLTDSSIGFGGRCVEGTGAGGEYFRVLLTGPFDQADDGTQLLVPAAIYDVGSLILVVDEEGIRYLRLTELTETTRSFSLFGFEAAPAPKMKTPLKTLTTSSPF